MRCAVRTLIVLVVAIAAAPAGGQTLTPTPAPTITAENEPWFLARAPLMIGGILYVPAGPQVHFNRDEMVRTGFYGAVPVYVQTTIEPGSVIFVPLSGGLMQPYQRRRSGELAGTEGSIPPSFPIESARPVGTTGSLTTVPRRPLSSASRPLGLNGIFITFSSRRWFNSGEPVPYDPTTFRQVGTYGTLPVYSRADAAETIFVPVSAAASTLVVPYTIDHRR
jgi:hypothetical protein